MKTQVITNKFRLILFVLIFGALHNVEGQVTIKYQSFESLGDDWNYQSNFGDAILGYDLGTDEWHTTTSAGGNTASDGSTFWGFQDITNGTYSGVHILEFDTVDISSYSDVEISFDWFAEALNGSDLIGYQINTDSSGWSSTIICNSCTTQSNGIISTSQTIIIPNGSNSVQLRLYANQDGGDQFGGFDNIQINGIPAGPNILVSTNTVSNLNYTFGNGPSAEQMVVVSGSSLVDDITLTAPTNFEISTTSGSGFTTSLSLPETSGTVSDTNIYVRLAESLAVNNYGPSNLTASSNTATDQQIALSGTVSNVVVGCNFSDDFNRADNSTIGNGWTEVGGDASIVSNELVIDNGSAIGIDYLYQDMNGVYTTQFENATGILTWEFNMQQFRTNPSGFNGATYGVAYILGGSDSDFTEGNGYAVVLGDGSSDNIRLASFSNGLNLDSNITNIITGSDSFGNEHTSIKVTYDPSSNTWELFVRDDNSTFSDPSTLTNTDSQGTAVNNTYVDENLRYTGPYWNHSSSANQTSQFDNICISEASACTTSIASLSIQEGGIGAIVTITGSGFSNTSTVTVNGVSAVVNFIDSNNVSIEIPSGATTGLIELTEGACSAQSASNFTVLGGGSCPTNNISDLIISEIYDGDSNNVWYIELYNPTAFPIDLDAIGSDYEIERYLDVDGDLERTIDLTGTIAANSTFLVNLGNSTDTCSATWDFTLAGNGINASDEIKLTKDGTEVDVIEAPAETGYTMLRLNTATGPSSTFSAADWNTNLSEDCSDLGNFTPLTISSPIINTQPIDVNTCQLASFSVDASPGNSGVLTYEWYFNDGVSATWTLINGTTFSPGTVVGEATNTISIFGFDVDGYQFYCDITENSLCTITSNTVQSNTQTTTWDGTIWSDGTPDSSTSAILNASYNTGTQTDFYACNLVINLVNAGTPARLTIVDDSFVEVENNIYAYGQLYVEHNGALKQVNDSGVFVSDNTNYTLVNKETSPLANWTDYTYWSSPVKDLTIGNAFFTSTYVYEFIAANYLDILAEVGNTGVFNPGQDFYDDNSDAWSVPSSTDILIPGFGYAATHSNIGFFPGNQYNYVFTGEFNNGVINVPISFNGANGDSDSNLLGNPYPSAISTDDFFAANAGVIDGVIYLWSHNIDASALAQGDEGLNYSPSDYAVINSGSGATASSDGNIPNNFVPSGQGFFVSGLANGTVVFNNSMRRADNTSNSQFFRTAPNNSADTPNKLWINLTTDTGLFNQILIAYVDGATNGIDTQAYDALRNLSSNTAAVLYSIIDENTEKKFAIQGKNPSALNIEEIIPIGISTNIENAAIYTLSLDQFEGLFLEENTIYLKDNLFETYHNLSESDYAFTLDVGAHDDRFELVFTEPQTLGLDNDQLATNTVEIIEKDQQTLLYKAHASNSIVAIEIYDVLGRQLAHVKEKSSELTVYLKGLTNTTVISKIHLENGAVIVKKILKRL